jgi:NAD(P)-dependent dehydrogenase (short-subunit alcohol dehydrogenase family)
VLFAREGAKVLAVDINRDAAFETKRIINGEGGMCEALSADVSRAADVAAMISACIATFGRIDVLHNNVGLVEVGGPVETTEESWDRVNDVNLKSMFLTCKQAVPHMERQGKGCDCQHRARFWHPLARGPLHLLRCDQGRGHSVHPRHCSSIRSLWHPGEYDPARDDEYADGPRPRGRCRLRWQCR